MIELPLFGAAAQSLAGLDISSSAVKLVELSGADGAAPVLERYAIEALPRDAVVDGNIANMDAVSEAIRRALRRFGAVRNVAAALPAASVIIKRIIVPAGLREHELEALVESEASQYIPFALDEVSLDFQITSTLPNNPGEVEVLVAASRRDKVEDRVAAAQAAGLRVVVMDVESLATEAALERITRELPQAGADRIIGLIDIGSSVMAANMFRNGQRIYAREQHCGGHQLTQDIARHYAMSIDEAESAKRESGVLDASYERDLLRPFMDGLALEVSRALQFFFTSTPWNAVDQLYLCGGSAVLPGLVDVVAARTQVDTRLANPFAAMQLSSRLRGRKLLDDAPALMTACGLALRRFDP